MKKRFFTLTILCCFFILKPIYSQTLDLGVFAGVGNYEGDLAPLFFVPQESQAAIGAFLRLNLFRYVSLRGQITQTKISGGDYNSSISSGRRGRNLSFESNISEFALMPEVNFSFFNKKSFLGRFSPYGFAGVAVYRFNPTTQFEGEKVSLQQLGTEGQGLAGNPEKYKLTQFSIPFGGGLKIRLSDNWSIGFEGNLRKTFTDYLDDVSTNYANDYDELIGTNGIVAGQLSARSWEYQNEQCNCEDNIPETNYPRSGTQRGDPTDLDWYFTVGATVSYTIRKVNLFSPRISCPTNF